MFLDLGLNPFGPTIYHSPFSRFEKKRGAAV